MSFLAHADAPMGALGGKAGAFARLDAHNLPIPPWFAVTPEGCLHSLPPGGEALLKSGDPEAVDGLLRDLSPAPGLRAAILGELDRFPEGMRFAVRSSAVAEDSKSASFAGMLESFLFLPREGVPDAVADVWRSAFAPRVRHYMAEQGLGDDLRPPAVLVQAMVDADCAGVAFRADPVTGDAGTCVVSAVYGLGSALVDGSASADVYHYHCGSGRVEATVELKDISHRAGGTGVVEVPVEPALQNARVLSDGQVADIAALAMRTSELFGHFQDIEWAYAGGQLYLLQSRPITSLGEVFEANARQIIFDNSNIAESYSGATTPLTFSFIRLAYAGVYEQFCRTFGVSEATIQKHGSTFKCMLASVDNQVYYNLVSWYTMLSFLPGYGVNRAFMEGMMGVKEPLPQVFLDQIHNSVASTGELRAYYQLLRSGVKLIGNYLSLERHIRDFYARLGEALEGPTPDTMTAVELYDYFHLLEAKLLRAWDAPIENDFFAMIFHGLLKSLCTAWGLPESVANDLLSGQGGIISAEPAKRITAMAGRARELGVDDILFTGDLREINAVLNAQPALREMVENYLAVFGDRCVDELKLESIPLTADPLPLYRSIGAAARREHREAPTHEPVDVGSLLRGHPLRRMLFGYVLKNARRLIKNRENLRFERTRIFGRVRQIFLEMGLHLSSRGVLDDRRDIFFLELEEIWGAVDMTGVSARFAELTALRKAEYEANRGRELPVRITVSGAAAFSPRRSGDGESQSTYMGDGMLRGIPCCAGRVRGRARVVTDPTHAQFEAGDILVAGRTDPGWIVLFHLAAGIIVEKGSLLSHASIVSREMGIPCIIAAEGCTKLIQDGDLIIMDGSTGAIEKEE